MSEKKYVGNAREINSQNGTFIKVELDLTQLFRFTKNDEEVKAAIREWTDKQGEVHKTIALVVAELKPENKTEYRTHSVKIDTWVKPKEAPKPPPQNQHASVAADDDLPF